MSKSLYIFGKLPAYTPVDDKYRRAQALTYMLKEDGMFWSIGENPRGFYDFVKAQVPKYDPEQTLNGLGIKFLAHVIYEESENGTWKCLKCRYAEQPALMFTSIEEAKLKSAMMKWPDPILVYDSRKKIFTSNNQKGKTEQ